MFGKLVIRYGKKPKKANGLKRIPSKYVNVGNYPLYELRHLQKV